jgi:hypothetical protein
VADTIVELEEQFRVDHVWQIARGQAAHLALEAGHDALGGSGGCGTYPSAR